MWKYWDFFNIKATYESCTPCTITIAIVKEEEIKSFLYFHICKYRVIDFLTEIVMLIIVTFSLTKS